MNRIFVFFVLSLTVMTTTFPSQSLSAETIKWHSYDEGMSLGKSQQKKIFINFFAEWCGYCVKMDKSTFVDPEIVSYLNKNFIAIKVDSDRQGAVASRYKVRGLPSSWFVSDNGEQIGNYPGYIPAGNLLPILKFIHTDSYKQMAFKDFMKIK
jgi:thioredoxin-related protein